MLQANIDSSIFLVFFVVSMQQQTQFSLTVYVTSSFALLPLTSTTSIVSSIVGGVFRLPTAKFVDLVGRAEGFGIMTGFAVIGTTSFRTTRRSLANALRSHHDGCLQKRR